MLTSRLLVPQKLAVWVGARVMSLALERGRDSLFHDLYERKKTIWKLRDDRAWGDYKIIINFRLIVLYI